MLIEEIKLNNIRSYANSSIKFPQSSVLLSGDIGCGKSSILLALEFALFGLSKKDLSGDSLLRKGKSKGEVEVKFKIDSDKYVIKRTLKKQGTKVVQDSGYILQNDRKKELTASELKSNILNLLGYPKEALTKKSLIYRYTIYTPQEDMKKILLEDNDYRLDTLRKVFGIDKYKKIRENTTVYLRHLKERRSHLRGKVEDLEDKKKELEEVKTEFEEFKNKIQTIEPKIKIFKEKFNEQKEKVEMIEKQMEKRKQVLHKLELADMKLLEKLDKNQLNKKELDEIDKEIKAIEEELDKIKIEAPKESSEKLKLKIDSMQMELIEINGNIKEADVMKKTADNENKQISRLIICPICKQEVTEEYKHKIHSINDHKVLEFTETIQKLTAKKNLLVEDIDAVKNQVEKLIKLERESELAKSKKEHLSSSFKEKEKRKQLIAETLIELKKEIGKINMEKVELNKEIEQLQEIDVKDEKQLLEKIQQELHSLEIEESNLKSQEKRINKEMEQLKEEVKEKLEAKTRITKLESYYNWLNDFFINLMTTMEKHVMAQVHKEFNDLFKEWFTVLLDDETINVRLDEEFTPIIEQNGYEIELVNMSGGEKTSTALAYRLALNKVINDLITTIKTKDLLILDEPTDGFSSEQLDRVRDVLDKLNLKQVIIVSHENKIESFVENTIRISKNEHISTIA